MMDGEELPSLVLLRIFRLLRLGRGRAVLQLFPELNLLVLGLKGAMRAIFWGLIFLFTVVLIWGILAVQLIHPLNEEIAHVAGCQNTSTWYSAQGRFLPPNGSISGSGFLCPASGVIQSRFQLRKLASYQNRLNISRNLCFCCCEKKNRQNT